MHKRIKKRSALRRRELLTALAVMLTLVLVIGGTVAFLIDVTDPVHNVFEPTKVTCYVDETINGNQKPAIRIQNTGVIDAYIRVIVSANYVNADGKICAAHDAPVLPATLGSGWSKESNGIYYYNAIVAPGGYTAPLFAEPVTLGTDADVDDCVVKMEIAASAIQAAGGAKDDAQKYGW